jgi:hypothetical protein
VAGLGLEVDESVVLANSDRATVRLLPCDVLARVAPVTHRAGAAVEVEVARRLADLGSPVAGPDPRAAPEVYEREGFAVTLWTYHEPVAAADPTPREYARALERLHAGMRRVDVAAPHFADRVAEAQGLVDDAERTPELADADRRLLSDTLRGVGQAIVERGASEQLLHGEPHAGNVLRTRHGLLFTDLETCCRGPVEFDIAHCSGFNPADEGAAWQVDTETPERVAAHYDGADPELVRGCRVLMLAMVAAWRWDRDDEFPDGRRMGTAYIDAIRQAVDQGGLGLRR